MRPTWEEYYISVMDAVALRGSCARGQSGCVIVKDKRILATGYVGAPIGLPTCEDLGHEYIYRMELKEKEFSEILKLPDPFVNSKLFSVHCVRTVHAEMNAILNCARNGVSTVGASLYCTMTPCINCAMAIIQAGISKVVSKNPYQKGQKSIEMFKTVGIEYICLNNNFLY